MLERSSIKYLITKRNSKADCRMDSEARKQLMLVDGNGLLKAYVFSIEGKMAAGAFRRARN